MFALALNFDVITIKGVHQNEVPPLWTSPG